MGVVREGYLSKEDVKELHEAAIECLSKSFKDLDELIAPKYGLGNFIGPCKQN